MKNCTVEDASIMAQILQMVMNRSADLVACLLLGVLQKSGCIEERKGNQFAVTDKYKRDYITVGMDGGVFLNVPQYPQRIRKTMVNMVGEQVVNRIRVVPSEDGSGKGAALCVAAAQRDAALKSKL